MDEVYVRYVLLPPRIKGLTVLDEDGNYNIYLNARLCYKTNKQTLIHELEHIKANDFHKAVYITEIEHKKVNHNEETS